jgi:hypothetical protein
MLATTRDRGKITFRASYLCLLPRRPPSPRFLVVSQSVAYKGRKIEDNGDDENLLNKSIVVCVVERRYPSASLYIHLLLVVDCTH